jgi:SAM-dependent methyltransferase
MKSDNHDKRMADVYSHIYGAFYDFESRSMERAHAMIGTNLEELGVAMDLLPSLNVLNIGTGRETLVFHQLKAKKVNHFDVSMRSVSRLNEMSRTPEFSSIRSTQADICIAGALKLDHEIDLIYLNGVLHHLHSTGVAAKNLAKSLRPSARVFFRIYRSGSLGFFVVDFIRRFVTYDDFQLYSKIGAERFSDTEDPAGIYADVVDDFFVPVLKLFDPRALDVYFEKNGFKVLRPREFKEYDHADTGVGGQGWSLYYEYSGAGAEGIDESAFPEHVDQLHGIEYAESFIKRTVVMMDEALDLMESVSAMDRINFALDMYEVSQTYRRASNDFARQNHERLQAILAGFIGKHTA